MYTTKNNIQYILSALLCFSIFSCEDVVELDLKEGPSRLVIEANINWIRNYPSNSLEVGNNQEIKLTQTAPYYQQEVVPATGASVSITNNSTNQIFVFQEQGNTGVYKTNNFVPALNNSYQLRIQYQGESYTAQSQFYNTPVIQSIRTEVGGVFSDDDYVAHLFYTDPAAAENHYYFNYRSNKFAQNRIEARDDQFTNGNSTYEILSFFDDDLELLPGDTIDILFYEISQANFDFLTVLVQQIESRGIFDPAPAEVKGNIVNLTKPDHYPYGYFRTAIGNRASYTIEDVDAP
ncbi:MAG: hypothetical protein OIF50_16350 [Flavobacteriaceae bacterium]|nr:hypothetical protein [Flavobacteriaceae bacterium]